MSKKKRTINQKNNDYVKHNDNLRLKYLSTK